MTSYLISYDISENKLRVRLAKELEKRGCQRIQKSVFLAPNFTNDEIRATQAAIIQLLKAGQTSADSVFCVPISKQQLQEMVWLGDAEKVAVIFTEILHFLI